MLVQRSICPFSDFPNIYFIMALKSCCPRRFHYAIWSFFAETVWHTAWNILQKNREGQRVLTFNNPHFLCKYLFLLLLYLCFLSHQRSETGWHYERWSNFQLKLETFASFLSARQNIESGHRLAPAIFVLSTWLPMWSTIFSPLVHFPLIIVFPCFSHFARLLLHTLFEMLPSQIWWHTLDKRKQRWVLMHIFVLIYELFST